MSSSSRFVVLESELTLLRQHLLPDPFEPTGEYPNSEKVITKTLAYRVLAHAEIESYLEDRVWEAALYAQRAFKNDGRIGKILISLIAFSGIQQEIPPKTLTLPRYNQEERDKLLSLSKKIDLAVNAFFKVTKNNHGLKESNILALTLPIGIDWDALDSAWISTMESFGSLRGKVAHTSASSYRTQQTPDPQDEFKKITQILEGLKELDKLVNDLIREN